MRDEGRDETYGPLRLVEKILVALSAPEEEDCLANVLARSSLGCALLYEATEGGNAGAGADHNNGSTWV